MSSKRQSFLGDIVAATMMLSRLPCGWYKFDNKTPPRLDCAGWAFPIVGTLIGAIGAIAPLILIKAGIGAFSAAIIAVIVMTLLSGGLHDDGFADMADGFGGGRTVDDKIRIMHDSRIGSYGVLALCLSVILRVSLLASLLRLSADSLSFAAVLTLIMAASRWQILGLLRVYPVSKKARLGQLTNPPPWSQLAVATLLWLVPAMVLFTPVFGLIMAGTGFVSAILIGKLAMRHIGGLTGDIMGASVISAESILMLSAVVALKNFPQMIGGA